MTQDYSSQDSRLSLTKAAAEHIAVICQQDERACVFFRISVSGGGCSGFQYHFDLDTQTRDDDLTFTDFGTKFVTDETSLSILKGSLLDYVEDLMGSSFRIVNPNAKSSCGCGNSFSV